MGGFSIIAGDQFGSVVNADNASFDGTSRGGVLTANGQFWIGNSVSPRVRKGTIISPLGSLTIGYSAPNITIDVNTGSVGQTITGNTGGPLSPTAGNWNILGTATNGIQAAGATSTLTVRMQSPYADADFSFESQAGGITRTLTVQNTVDAASSQATNLIKVAGGTSSNVWTQYSIGAINSWSLGIHNSDSDAFKINTNASGSVDPSSGTELVRISTAGRYDFTTIDNTITSQFHFGGNFSQDLGLLIGNSSTNAAANTVISMTVASGGTADAISKWAITNAQTWSAGLDNSDGDAWVLSSNNGLGTNNTIHVTTSGVVTFPLTSAFLAFPSAGTTNATGDGTAVTLPCNTVVFDQNSNYSNSTFNLTAPITGRYRLTASCQCSNLLAAHTSGFLQIITSNRNYSPTFCSPGACQSTVVTAGNYTFNASCLADMDAADTASGRVTISGGTKTVTIAGTGTNTFFCGELAC